MQKVTDVVASNDADSVVAPILWNTLQNGVKRSNLARAVHFWPSFF